MSQIEGLSPEQEALLPLYRQRWREIALSTQPINTLKATAAVKAAYEAMGKAEPKIMILLGPQAAQATLKEKALLELLQEFGQPLFPFPLAAQLSEQVQGQLAPSLLSYLKEQLSESEENGFSLRLQTNIWKPLGEVVSTIDGQSWHFLSQQMLGQYWEQQQQQWRQQLQAQPGGDWLLQIGDTVGQFFSDNLLQPLQKQPLIQDLEQGLTGFLGFFSMLGLGWQTLISSIDVLSTPLLDFAIEVLGCNHDGEKWQAWRSLLLEAGPFLAFEKVFLMLDRPNSLSLDGEQRLHAEGEPALAFADGYHLYFFQNVELPERYGQLMPQQWQSQWLLTEENAELRRVLLQGIGYARLCQELQATELDSWREYTLLRIESDIDVEPIYLLKMTCPSTGYIHATRVPPQINSAREAIRWVNWDVDPEEFVLES